MTSSSDLRERIRQLDEKIDGLVGQRRATIRELTERETRNGSTPAADSPVSHLERPMPGESPYGGGLEERALGIDHAAIAVRDLQGAVRVLCNSFGFEVAEERRVEGSFSGMNSVVLRAGRVKLVLVQGTSPQSNVSRYIDHYGPGVQHLAIEVDDAECVLEDLRRRGCDLLTGVIHSPGLDQVFTRRDPRSGMQIEFVARTENDGFSEHNVRELFQAMERENAF